MTKQPTLSTPALWARFRFSVVGALFSAPPARGELKAALESLAAKTWMHPVSGHEVRFAPKTIESWFYRARQEQDDPVGVLRRAVRKDCGKVSLKPGLIERLANQYQDYPHWTYQLHYDNLKALVKADAKLGPLQSYSTLRRYMVAQGMLRKPRLKPKKYPGELRAAQRRERRESGTGKSVALRIVAQRLSALRDVTVGVIERPQSNSADFYRELGDVFSVPLRPSNRWGGFRALRERWKAHVAATRMKPALLVDEAQQMHPSVLSELRILASADFDATSLLTVILCGDGRLLELLRQEDLVPLGTRIRTRLHTEPATRDQLLRLLQHALSKAGNATLMTAQLIDTLVDHAAGNYRVLMTMGADLLAQGLARQVEQLDEKLYLELYQPHRTLSPSKKKARV
jgi:type II secretory pathway predicted ATPase ExeA